MTPQADEQTIGITLAAHFRAPVQVTGVTELAGDASTRRYYRVRMAPGAPLPSLIMMRYPDEVPPGRELPFVNVHRYLRKAGVPVPEIHLAMPDSNLLFLEDAGDTMLEGVVHSSRSTEEVLPLYERCMEILARIQWDGTRALLEDLFLPFLAELAALPRVLAHRDYHSRNIMVIPGGEGDAAPELRILDFQDARMGNIYYDLCSLLRDSYVTLPDKAVEELVYVYRHCTPSRIRQMGGRPDAFSYLLDVSALQRNVKAIGTFGNQAHTLGKKFYVRFIPPTVAHLSANFERNSRMKPLARKLLPFLSELAGKAASEALP
jgi:aminoglycoside/choline kinase family phosphotransferase